MKKANLLSKAELKEVMGGVPIASYCGEGQVLAECMVSYQVWVGGGGYWGPEGWISMPGNSETHHTWVGGCMPEGDYLSNQSNCRLIGVGGPYPIG